MKLLHAADLHLDSAFAGLSDREAALCREESRTTVRRLVDWGNDHGADVMLLAGDLFDSDRLYSQTAQTLALALGRFRGKIFLAPGNHDFYAPGSSYDTVAWPENVHIFTQPRLETMEWPEKNLVLHGAAFTHGEQADGFLTGFTAPADGKCHLMVLHGDCGKY